MVLPEGVCGAGYPWNGYPPRYERGARPIWRANHWEESFFASGRVVPEGQGPKGIGASTTPCSTTPCQKRKNTCCDACSDLLDSRQ